MTIVTERPPAATAGPGDERRRIAGALAALARRTGEMPPHPYLCRNLAEHASAAGVLDDEHLPGSFLLWDSSGRIGPLLGLPITDSGAHRRLAAWARVERFLTGAAPASRRLSLGFICRAFGVDPGIDPRAHIGGGVYLTTRWNAWYAPGNVLTAGPEKVSAVAAIPLPGGRMVVAAGGSDGTVRLWDPVAGTPVADSLRGYTDRVTSLVTVPIPDGRTLLASGGADGVMRLWDPVAAIPLGEFPHAVGYLAVAAVPMPDGRTLLAAGGDAGTVRLWDPVAGVQVGKPLRESVRVRGLAGIPLPDGYSLLATGGADGKVRLWEPTDHSAGQWRRRRRGAGRVLAGHTSGAVLTTLPLPDGTLALVSGGEDGTVRVWNPATGTTIGEPLMTNAAGVASVAAVPLPDGRTLLATGGWGGTVRLWDFTTRSRRPLEGHEGKVCMAAVPLPDRRVLLATGGADGTVRLWDTDDSDPIGALLSSGTIVPIWTVATVSVPDGRTLLATGGWDGTVRLWDPATGTQVVDPLSGHAGPVASVAAVPLPDGRVLLASGSRDETLRLWDPTTGKPVGQPLTGHVGTVAAIAAVPLPSGRTVIATG